MVIRLDAQMDTFGMCGLRWHFKIVREGTFENKKLDHIMKIKWSKHVPPFRKYKDATYWFSLKNLRKIKKGIALMFWGENLMCSLSFL